MEPDDDDDNAQRRADEVEALRALYPDDDAVSVSSNGTDTAPVEVAVSVGQAKLHAALPAAYPGAARAERLVVSSATLSRAATERLTATVNKANAALPEGQEALFELVQVLEDEAAREVERLQEEAAAAEAARKDDGASAGTTVDAVVRIDHMNAPAGYMKLLRKWAHNGGIGARAFFREASGGRYESIFIILVGEEDSVKNFLHRLKTEYVDVDSAGGKCKERQSTTLCLRPAATPPGVDGFEARAYADETALEEYLAELGVLHVGPAAQRFGALAS